MWWTIISWLACATGFAGTWLVLRHARGWLITAMSGILWVAFNLHIHCWAGVFASSIGALIAIRNWRGSR